MTLRNYDLKEQVRAYWTARADARALFAFGGAVTRLTRPS